MKVVLDTNVIVSRHISRRGAPARIYEQWELGRFDVLVTTDILNEYADMLSRSSIQRQTGILAGGVGQLLAEIVSLAVSVEPERIDVGISSDPDDDVFLECAAAGDADYIVTGDRHLLELEVFQNIPIVRPALFAAILEHMDDQ